MKNAILFLVCTITFNSNASIISCLDNVQQQVSAVTEHYHVEVTTYFVDKEAVKNEENTLNPIDSLYSSSNLDLDNSDVVVAHADSETMGCYGYELVTFNIKTCELLAIGGGYCD